MDEYIFDEQDELDTVLLCSDEMQFNLLKEEVEKPVSLLEDYTEQKSLDCVDIPKDETDVSPIGSEAELYIDVDKELFVGDDEDNDLIDLVGGL